VECVLEEDAFDTRVKVEKSRRATSCRLPVKFDRHLYGYPDHNGRHRFPHPYRLMWMPKGDRIGFRTHAFTPYSSPPLSGICQRSLQQSQISLRSHVNAF